MQGSRILHSDEDDGELDSNTHKYAVSKIIDFPGFNQDPGENFFDVSKVYLFGFTIFQIYKIYFIGLQIPQRTTVK